MIADEAGRVLTVYAVYLLAAMSPGPAVFYVMRAAVSDRRVGLRGAWGVSTGTTIWVCVAALGLSALLLASPALSAAIRLAGAGYLLWLAFKLGRASLRPVAGDAAPSFIPRDGRAAYAQGVATNTTNPGTALFFTALLGSYKVEAMPAGARAAVYCGIPLLSLCWYSALALIFSDRRLAAAYLRLGRPLDAALSLIFLALGLKLAAAALH